jgi:DeoR family fructose operon transcriptional repressor
MFATERRHAILEAIRVSGRAAVGELAELLDVTPATVRRDLSELESKGLLQRTHGGAVIVERMSYSTPVTDRSGRFDAEKEAIAERALQQITDDSTVAIDAGTSTIALARLLTPDRRLTVVTYSLIVATTLAPMPDIRVHFLGGEVRENSRATVGQVTVDQASRFTLDAVFLSVDGIHPQFGITTHNLQEAEVKAALMAGSRRTVVLADRSKLRRSEFARVAPLSDVDEVITDSGARPEDVRLVGAAGPVVSCAAPFTAAPVA